MKEIRVANFMDSSLVDLDKKGNLESACELYNPNGMYSSVTHFTPFKKDLHYRFIFEKASITLYSYEIKLPWPIKIIGEFVKVFIQFKKSKFQIIRGRLPYLGSLYGLLNSKLFNVPFIVSLGGNNRICQEKENLYHYNSKFISYSMEKFVLKHSDKIICPNAYTKEYVASIIGKCRAGRKCNIIPWISEPVMPGREIEVDIYSRFSIPQEVLLIPIIGFLNRYKYTDVLYKLLKTWKSPLPDKQVMFVFCGSGSLHQQGSVIFKDNSNVKFIGWQNKKVIHSFIQYATLILIPMSGFVLLEAASAGKAVITSNVEWHSEIISEGETGLLVNPESVQDWADKIKFALQNPEIMRACGKKLEAIYWKSYSPESLKTQEVTLYLNALKKDGVKR